MSDQMASVGIDFSDWTVSTGNSKASGATDNNGLSIPPWLIFAAVGLAAVVAVKWIKSK
jgi:disulfide bond formation protein DsbB